MKKYSKPQFLFVLQKRLGPQKQFFALFSENSSFFLKLLNNKIFNTSFVIKKSNFNFWPKTPSFPEKLSNASPKQFFMVFSENTTFFEKIVE